MSYSRPHGTVQPKQQAQMNAQQALTCGKHHGRRAATSKRTAQRGHRAPSALTIRRHRLSAGRNSYVLMSALCTETRTCGVRRNAPERCSSTTSSPSPSAPRSPCAFADAGPNRSERGAPRPQPEPTQGTLQAMEARREASSPSRTSAPVPLAGQRKYWAVGCEFRSGQMACGC